MTADKPVRRVAFITSHPIQYQAPLFRKLASRPGIDLTVYFCSRWGVERYEDKGFGKSIAWDIDLLSGYRHRFLRNYGLASGPQGFAGLVNPAILSELRSGYDAVISTGWFTANHWITWVSAWVARVPLLLRAESSALSEAGGWKRVAKRALLRAMFSRVSAFLAIGTHTASYYRSFRVPGEKIFASPYAVENERFLADGQRLRPSKSQLREKRGIHRDQPLFLFSGKLIAVKQPLDLLRAFETLQRNGLSASLAFTGDGELRPGLEAYVRDRGIRDVHFLGFQNQTEISECYAMADALVLPSGYEPWGLVVNEAMCFGLAIVASDRVGSVPDLVTEGVNGYCFPAGDVACLAARMRELASDPVKLARFGEESRRIIRHWGLEEGVDGIMASLDQLAGGGVR